eukprot:TRINITY_DN67279_c4_g1_i1.p1 TRINITY_DN67279_c4_g1~~TRINITY_DN67279_c4_g1_i1.p1  ORF type:complete len:280 (-),score=10.50 TRINITY_DN67279_c4_g1_i1:42-881(-)
MLALRNSRLLAGGMSSFKADAKKYPKQKVKLIKLKRNRERLGMWSTAPELARKEAERKRADQDAVYPAEYFENMINLSDRNTDQLSVSAKRHHMDTEELLATARNVIASKPLRTFEWSRNKRVLKHSYAQRAKELGLGRKPVIADLPKSKAFLPKYKIPPPVISSSQLYRAYEWNLKIPPRGLSGYSLDLSGPTPVVVYNEEQDKRRGYFIRRFKAAGMRSPTRWRFHRVTARSDYWLELPDYTDGRREPMKPYRDDPHRLLQNMYQHKDRFAKMRLHE